MRASASKTESKMTSLLPRGIQAKAPTNWASHGAGVAEVVAGDVEISHDLIVLQGFCNSLASFCTQAVAADIKLHQRPDGEKYIRGGTEGQRAILDILVLTCTQG